MKVAAFSSVAWEDNFITKRRYGTALGQAAIGLILVGIGLGLFRSDLEKKTE
jgi:hypothetical protein